ncbi:MAG: sulfotransferase [Paracoccaceae bacterium]|nr:sulfotransferase [Paracoccaceae bacterium]
MSAGRAGSSFVCDALNLHPLVCCQLESHHLPLLIETFGLTAVHPRALLAVTKQAVFHTGEPVVYSALANLNISEHSFVRWQTQLIAKFDVMTISEFQEALSAFFLFETDKLIFVDKTPCYSWYISSFRKHLLESRFVNLARDCGPSVNSMLEHPGFLAKIRTNESTWTSILLNHSLSEIDFEVRKPTKAEILDMARLWAIRTNAAYKFSEPDHVLDLTYEELIENPRRFFEKLCISLDIPMNNEWLEQVVKNVKPSRRNQTRKSENFESDFLILPEVTEVRSRLGYE